MRSEPTPVRREDIDTASAWLRDPAVRTDEVLDFLDRTRGSLNREVEEVVENRLVASLWSVELDAVRRPVARRKMLETPDVIEDLD